MHTRLSSIARAEQDLARVLALLFPYRMILFPYQMLLFLYHMPTECPVPAYALATTCPVLAFLPTESPRAFSAFVLHTILWYGIRGVFVPHRY